MREMWRRKVIALAVAIGVILVMFGVVSSVQKLPIVIMGVRQAQLGVLQAPQSTLGFWLGGSQSQRL